jgi:hypothetical protein
MQSGLSHRPVLMERTMFLFSVLLFFVRRVWAPGCCCFPAEREVVMPSIDVRWPQHRAAHAIGAHCLSWRLRCC